MGENARMVMIAAIEAFAERCEIDIGNVTVLHESGAITQDEADELRARLAGEMEKATEMAAEFRKFL
jgi:hypothetical protein